MLHETPPSPVDVAARAVEVAERTVIGQRVPGIERHLFARRVTRAVERLYGNADLGDRRYGESSSCHSTLASSIGIFRLSV